MSEMPFVSSLRLYPVFLPAWRDAGLAYPAVNKWILEVEANQNQRKHPIREQTRLSWSTHEVGKFGGGVNEQNVTPAMPH